MMPTVHLFFLFFLIGIHSMQGWTATPEEKEEKKE